MPSRCTEEFRLRKIKNDQLKAEAKAKGEKISTKRQPQGPKPGFMVEGATLETVTPIPYDVVNDLKGGYQFHSRCWSAQFFVWGLLVLFCVGRETIQTIKIFLLFYLMF